MGNTVITSYVVDSYPLQSMSVITFYSVLLNFSAFADPVSLFHFSLPTQLHLIALGPRSTNLFLYSLYLMDINPLVRR
jgi:hypothetical protein